MDNPVTVQTFPPSKWFRLALAYLLIPLALLVLGGDAGWRQAWVLAALIFAAGMGARAWAEWRHPGLMAERETRENTPGVKSWDKALAPLMAVTISIGLFVVAGLDHRYGWSPEFPLWLNLLGLALVALGYAFGAWAMVENRFFSGMVRIQTDRGHTVCDSGPYRFVRHPGYAGNILALPGVALCLGSLWTFVPAALALVIAVTRTELEDRTLQEELPGYRDYARRVRYRLLPGVY